MGLEDIEAKLAAIKARIAAALRDAARDSGAAQLVAVTKMQPEDAIRAALAAGQRHFGENRVQEAAAKWPALKTAYPDIELHLIGPLQTNKARDAVLLFDVIETVDRDKLARELAREMARCGLKRRCFIQVNTGDEAQKAGVPPRDADRFIRACREDYGLTIDGLMCIPPVDEEPALHFALLKKIAERNGLRCLSMGMSEDFERAIALGATQVRIGSAIFGARS